MFILLTLFLLVVLGHGVPLHLRLLTWNIRYDSKPDTIPVSTSIASLSAAFPSDRNTTYYASANEAPWSTRRLHIYRTLLFSRPDIIGVQEALHRQVLDLSELLGPSWGWVGVGRDDGQLAGEFEAIFYRRAAVSLTGWDTFWLSDTPDTPSKFPGAGSVRTATIANFVTDGGKRVTVVCTHWDEQSDAQRRVAASLVRVRAAWEAAENDAPVFVLGDFNSQSGGSESGGYDIITAATPPVAINKTFAERYSVDGLRDDWGLRDVAVETEPLYRMGHLATFTDFRTQAEMWLKRIDFVVAGEVVRGDSSGGEGEEGGRRGKPVTWRSEGYMVGETWYDNAVMQSDHRPVWVDVVL